MGLELLLGHRCALSHAYLVEVVAVVQFHGSVRAAEGVAVVESGSFGEGAGSVAVVEGCGSATVVPCNESAVHRATLVTHRAKRSTIVERDVGIVGSKHTAIARHLIHGSCDVDVRDDILNEYGAVCTSDEGAIVDLCHIDTAFDAKVADCGSIDEREEAAPLFRYVLVVIGDCMAASVEDTSVLSSFRTDHEVWVFCFAQVNVRQEFGIDPVGSAIHHVGKDDEVRLVAQEEVSIFLFGIETDL